MKKTGKNPLKITDLTFRDGHQSLFATRMRTEDIEAVAETVGRVGSRTGISTMYAARAYSLV